MSKTKIEWATAVWNPTTGCNKISQGCKNCYAEVMHKRLRGLGLEKYRRSFLEGAVEHPDALQLPYTWIKPQRVFVNSMSDLFHENLSFQFIREVFQVMKDTPWHTYMVLTKRAGRMLLYSSESNTEIPKNVWLGVSVENQQAADERIPLLIKVPAAVRFLSCEPLLGPINLTEVSPFILKGRTTPLCCINSLNSHPIGSPTKPFIDWVICGGESGPNARPMHPDWARSLRDQCNAAGISFFFKQWGTWQPDRECKTAADYDCPVSSISKGIVLIDEGGKHDDKLFLQEKWPTRWRMLKVGKKTAGHLLDGKEHFALPQPINEFA